MDDQDLLSFSSPLGDKPKGESREEINSLVVNSLCPNRLFELSFEVSTKRKVLEYSAYMTVL